jgi:hypothetical protein
MNMQIIPDDAIEILKASDIDSRIIAVKAVLKSLFDDLRDLNPLTNEHGKYLDITASVHGYDDLTVSFAVYYGASLNLGNVDTFRQIKEAIDKHNPEKQRIDKISKLRSELAALENEQQPALTA